MIQATRILHQFKCLQQIVTAGDYPWQDEVKMDAVTFSALTRPILGRGTPKSLKSCLSGVSL